MLSQDYQLVNWRTILALASERNFFLLVFLCWHRLVSQAILKTRKQLI